MTLRRCSASVRDLVRLVGDMVDGHCSLLFIDMTSSDKDDLPLLFEFSNNILSCKAGSEMPFCTAATAKVCLSTCGDTGRLMRALLAMRLTRV
jgi:hypothetical protein